MKRSKKSDIDDFIALPEAKKAEIIAEIDAEAAEQRLARSRPLGVRDRAKWAAFKKRAARQESDTQGIQTISINVKQSLLKKADRYAKQHKLSRSQLFNRSLQRLMKAP